MRIAIPPRTALAAVLLITGCAAPETPPSAPAATTADRTGPAPAAPASAADEPLARAAKAFAEGALEDAVEAAKEAAERDPTDPRPWVLRARCERTLAARATEAGDGTNAQLRLLDAVASARKAVDLDTLRTTPTTLHWDQPFVELGLSLRDSFKFTEAAEAFRAAQLGGAGTFVADKRDTIYELAYCRAYAGDFKGALETFREAETLLGPQARIAVNAAICEEHLGDRGAAVARLAAFYAREVEAGRGGGTDARWVLDKTWELTVQKMDFEAGKAAFAALADAHPARPEPSFMLGNLLSFRGDSAGAAAAYERSLKAEERPATRLRMAAALAASGNTGGAEIAMHEALEKNPDAEGTLEAVLSVGRALLANRRPTGARELAEKALGAFPEDSDLLLLAGDCSMAEGDFTAALASYRKAAEASSLSTEPAARVARAGLAAARSDVKVEAEFVPKDAPGDALDPVPPAEVLAGFEESSVFVRGEGCVAALKDGALRIRPGGGPVGTPGAAPPADPSAVRGGPAGPGGVGGGGGRWNRTPLGPLARIEFFPFLDATAWESLTFRARTYGGAAAVRVAILDGYDEAGSSFARSHWPAEGPAIAVGGGWTEVRVPVNGIRGFVAGRPLPPLLQRVRAFLVALEAPPGDPAPTLYLDDFVLRGPGGKQRALANFDGTPEETLVIYGGTCVPFERTLFNDEQVATFAPPGTTVYAPHVLGKDLDPARVGAGKASLRVHHGEGASAPAGPFGRVEGAAAAGASTVTIRLNPDRDVQRFRALTFLARGEKGGEKLRVRLRDAHDVAMERVLAAGRWPASLFPRTAAADGTLKLGAGWRMVRVPFDSYPEIDRSALAEIAFECGEDVGNGKDATIYLDEIGLGD